MQVYQCSVTNENGEKKYASSQLVIQKDLKLLYQQLQSVTVSANPKTISCCGGSSTLSTTAYFKLVTKTEDDTTTASAQTSATVTGSYKDDKSYTTISGSKITFEKNSIDYPTSTSATERSSTVTGSYTYSGSTKTNTVTITQSENSVGSWTWVSDTTTSIGVSPSSMSFESGGGEKSYSVTRYYKSYYEKYDNCSVVMDSKTENNSVAVTPSEATCSGDFTCTKSKVSCETNTGAARTGTLTVKWGSFSDTCSLSQGASQAGTTNGEPYDYSYSLYVTSPKSSLPCTGGTEQFSASYITSWKYDWVTKDAAGTVTNSGTSTDSSSTYVTNSASWETTKGTVSTGGLLTYGASSSNDKVTYTVTATYSGESDSSSVYQENCGSSDTGTTGTSEVCMDVVIVNDNNCSGDILFKDSNGTKIEELSIADGEAQTFCYDNGKTVYISMKDDDGTTCETSDGGNSFTVVEGGTVTVNVSCSDSGGDGGDTGTTCTESNSWTGITATVGTVAKCDTSASFTVKANGTHTNTDCSTAATSTTLTSSNYTVKYGKTSGSYTLTSIEANETSSAVTWYYQITANSTYGSKTKTGSFEQAAGPCTVIVYTYTFKNCHSDKQISLFASNATPSGSHTNYAMLSTIDGTSVQVLIPSTGGTPVNGSANSMGGTAYIGDSVKIYSVTTSSSVWTLEETITLTAKDRSFEYGCDSIDCCDEVSITCSPSKAVLSGDSVSTTVTVTSNNNSCNTTWYAKKGSAQDYTAINKNSGDKLTVSATGTYHIYPYACDSSKVVDFNVYENPILETISVANNLPGEFYFTTSELQNSKTVSAGSSEGSGMSTMLTNGGSITFNIPKSSITSETGGLCGGCHIMITYKCDSIPNISVNGGNFKIDADGLKWTPSQAFYNGEGDDTMTLYTGNSYIYITVHNNS